jgi:hypothetical protein
VLEKKYKVANAKRNLANNIGGELTWVLGTLFYKGDKSERGENWFHKTRGFHSLFSVYFLFAITKSSIQKTIRGLQKYWGLAFGPPPLLHFTPMARSD